MVPWSPLGSGFLTGKTDPLGADDFRRYNPRYSGGNLVTNRDRFAPLLAVARELGVTPAQLALAWLLHQGPDIIPIPGTRRPERVDENAKASTVTLDRLLEKIDKIAPPCERCNIALAANPSVSSIKKWPRSSSSRTLVRGTVKVIFLRAGSNVFLKLLGQADIELFETGQVGLGICLSAHLSVENAPVHVGLGQFWL